MEFSKKNELTFEQNHCDCKIGGCVSHVCLSACLPTYLPIYNVNIIKGHLLE